MSRAVTAKDATARDAAIDRADHEDLVDAEVPVMALEEQGAALPVWVLRLVAAMASAGIVTAVGMDGAPPAVLVVLGLIAASGVLSPGSAAPAAVAGFAALISTGYAANGVLRPTVFALVFLVHLLHVTSGMAAVLPNGGRLYLRALRGPLRRFVVIQAAVFAIAGLAAVLPAGRNPVMLEVLAVLAVAGTAVLGLALLRRR